LAKIHFINKLRFTNIFQQQKKNGKCYPEFSGENELINSKLVFEPIGHTTHDHKQPSSITLINAKQLLKWINRNLKKRNYQYLDYEKILMMLSNCESAVEKSQQMLLLNQNEMNNYLKLYHKIECGIIEAERNYTICKQKLKSSEYDSKHDSAYKLETLRNLSKLETEIGNLNSIKDDLCFKLAKRQRQCHDLLNTAQTLQTMFAKEEHQIANAIENHLKSKQRTLLKQQLMSQGFMKHEFNNVLAMDSIVAIDTQTSNRLNTSNSNTTTNTTLLPDLNKLQNSIASTTPNVSSSIFRSTPVATSILQRDCSDNATDLLTSIKMPKIFLRDVSGKFISKTVKNFGKESNNKINIKLNKLHLISNPVQLNGNTANYKVFDMVESHPSTTMISCR